jgi:hypothetical protein
VQSQHHSQAQELQLAPSVLLLLTLARLRPPPPWPGSASLQPLLRVLQPVRPLWRVLQPVLQPLLVLPLLLLSQTGSESVSVLQRPPPLPLSRPESAPPASFSPMLRVPLPPLPPPPLLPPRHLELRFLPPRLLLLLLVPSSQLARSQTQQLPPGLRLPLSLLVARASRLQLPPRPLALLPLPL